MTSYEVKSFLRFFEKVKQEHSNCCIEVTFSKRPHTMTGVPDYVYEYYDEIINMNDVLNLDEVYAIDYYGKPITKNENGELVVSKKGHKVNTYRALSMNIVAREDIKL